MSVSSQYRNIASQNPPTSAKRAAGTSRQAPEPTVTSRGGPAGGVAPFGAHEKPR